MLSLLNNLKMLIYIFLLAVATFARSANIELPNEFMEQLSQVHQVCVDETRVNEEHIEKANAGNFIKDEKLSCYTKCITVRFGVMDADGNIFPDAIDDKFPEAIKPFLKLMIETCKPQADKQKDICDKAYELHYCAQKTDPEHYFLV